MMVNAMDDYSTISLLLAHLERESLWGVNQKTLEEIAGLESKALEALFRRWCGLTPMAFLQTQRLDYARSLLRQNRTVLDTAFEVGLSGPGRLHDLFVRYEAMPPGIYRAGGRGIELITGWHDSPFGQCFIASSAYGLAALAFADKGEEGAVESDIRARWPHATYCHDPSVTEPHSRQIFSPETWQREHPLKVAPIGSDFDRSVWQKLLTIKPGMMSTYGTIADQLGKPGAARAIGGAVGRNPLSFIIPCHRVVGIKGNLTGYHWGIIRKRALIGWEAGRLRYSEG